MVLPAIVLGAIYYAYNSPGWLSLRVQRMIDPILVPVMRWTSQIFGGG